ncbi:hypothetical protein ACQJ7M_01000 [Helicobacter pylori]
MIVLKNAQSLFKKVRNSFKRVRILCHASDIFSITACKRPKVKDKPTHKETPKLFRLRERS